MDSLRGKSWLIVRQVVFGYGTKSSGDWLQVLDRVSCKFASGRITALVGPSGCGKTSLLNVIAGLETPLEGSVVNEVGGTQIGYVFQSPSLIPWRNNLKNALLGSEIVGQSAMHRRRAEELFLRLGLAGFERSYPSSLSGGMQQRVSIIRAVVSGTRVMLLDEPFANSDFLMRQELQCEVSKLVDEEQLVAVLVTHDIEEAARIADRVVVLTHRPARVKADIEIPIARNDRLEGDPAVLQRIAPYLDKIWKALKSSDEAGCSRDTGVGA